MKVLLFTIIFTINQTVLAFGQQTTGNCSPVMDNTLIGGSVTINCTGIAPKALAKLNELLENLDSLPDSNKTIKNFHRLFDLQERDLATKNTELRQTQLTLDDKVRLAEEWRQKYLDLETRLLGEDSDELGKKAAEALQGGDLDLAGELLDQLIAKRELVVDKLAANHFNRAEVFQLQYKSVQALSHLKKAYNYRPENREYAFDYGLLLSKQQQFKQAILIYEALLSQSRKLAQANPKAYEHHVVVSLSNLAFLYYRTSRYEEAETYYLETLQITKKLAQAHPNDYEPDIAIILNNLALLYNKTNRDEFAEKYFLEALRICRKLAQADPAAYEPDVAGTLNNLANMYSENSRYKETEAYFLEALTIYREFAQDNPNIYNYYVAGILNNLAALYSKTNRYKKAKSHFLESLKVRKKLAQANPNAYESDLANTLTALAVFYLQQGNLLRVRQYTSEALPIYRHWYKKYPKIFGEKLAATLFLKGMATTDKKIACQNFQEVLKINPPQLIKQIALVQVKQCQLQD